MERFGDISFVCCRGPVDPGYCVCSRDESTLRRYSAGESLRPMNTDERAWAVSEADRVGEGYYKSAEPDFMPMDSAPKDGTEIEILFRHVNWRYASERDRDDWQQICRAYWTDFNGGGWVWHGICGVPMGWRRPANVELTGRTNA